MNEANVDQRLDEMLTEKAQDGKISCRAAQDTGDVLGVSYARVGKRIEELGLKIVSCQLGCF